MWQQDDSGSDRMERLQMAQAIIELMGGMRSGGSMETSALNRSGSGNMGLLGNPPRMARNMGFLNSGFEERNRFGGSSSWNDTSAGRSMPSGSWPPEELPYEGGDGYPLRANQRPPLIGDTARGVPSGPFPIKSSVSRFGAMGQRKPATDLTAGERREVLTKLWSGFTGADFDMVPSKYLFCRDCHVRTESGNFFLNHLKGTKHNTKMEAVMTENIDKLHLMQKEIKAAEDQKYKESGVAKGKRERCKMCNVSCSGQLVQHRGQPYHQKLKGFTHPNCDACQEHFQDRLEWEAHRFLPQHLLMVAQMRLPADAKLLSDIVFEDELNKMLKKGGAESEASSPNKPAGKPKATVTMTKPKIVQKVTKAVVTKKAAPEPVGSLKMYEPDKPVGKEHVVTITRFMCKLCKQFIPNEAELQEHLRSRTHWNKCVEAAGSADPPKKLTAKKPAAEVVSTTADDEEMESEDAEGDDDVVVESSTNGVGKRKGRGKIAAEAKKKK